MSTKKVLPLYVADYLADTPHLTAEEHGAYLKLLMAACVWDWALPNDRKQLQQITRVTPRRWDRVWATLAPFFEDHGDTLTTSVVERWKRKNARPPIPAALRRIIRERDGDVCAYCGATSGVFHVDHIVPWSRGGMDEPSNLVVACAPCNLSKSDLLLEEWLA